MLVQREWLKLLITLKMSRFESTWHKIESDNTVSNYLG